MPWKIGQCIMVRTDERWVLCYICMCKSIEGQSQIKIPSINLIRDQFSMNWASWNDYQASHIFFPPLFCNEKDCNKFSNFSCMILNPKAISNLNSNCSNLLDMRNLQDKLKKTFCCQKLFWTFTVWKNLQILGLQSRIWKVFLDH